MKTKHCFLMRTNHSSNFLVTNLIVYLLAQCVLPANAEYDYFRNAQLPGKRRVDVSLDKVQQEGSEVPAGYQRRVVEWWPKKGVDIVDVPEGVSLRTWTINPESLGSSDPKKLRWWPLALRGERQFKAHLVAIRGVAGMGIGNPWNKKGDGPDYLCPAVVLRLEDGRKRCFTSGSFVEADERYICDLYEKEMQRLRDGTFKQGIEWKVDPDASREFPRGELYKPGTAQIETEHFVAVLGAEDPKDNAGSLWLMDNDKNAAARNRTLIMRGWEDWWAYLEYAGHLMPYWEKPGTEKYKYKITIGGSKKNGLEILGRGNGGSYGGMTTPDGNWWGLYHEWTYGQLCGGMISLGGGETMCDAAQTMGDPRITAKMMFQVVKPWKNLFWGAYPGGYGWTSMSDDPNWGYCAVGTLPPLMSDQEHTPMHVIARLGKERGIFTNGVRGTGDFMGQIGARMAEFDTELQGGLRQQFTMPTRVALQAVDLDKRIYRSPVMYSPEPFGVNIIRLLPDKGATNMTVDFQGHYDPETFSDWRACIVAVDAEGRCRYSPLWNKGTMSMDVKPGDRRFWLTVTATPYALSPLHPTGANSVWAIYQGGFSYRYPYDVQLSACRPDSPHTTLEEDDVLNLVGGVWGMRNGEGANCANVPTPADTPAYAVMFKELGGKNTPVAKSHLENAKGKRHPNGGGWVAESATVDATAYVAAGAMVLGGAKVLGHAVINDYAIVMGPNVTIKDNARVYGKVIVDGKDGKREYSGNARVYLRDEEREDVALDSPQQRGTRFKELDYRLQANYECDVADEAVLEDYYKEHSTDVFFYGAHRADLIFFDGILRGRPGFVKNGKGGAFTFNGKDQYAELPGEVADLEEITIDLGFLCSDGGDQNLYQFGTSDKCYIRLSVINNVLKLTTVKNGVASTVDGGVIPSNAWTDCRVEINGKTIAIHGNNKKTADITSGFHPSDAFVPGEPRLGFLAAGFGGSKPMKGAIDFFRIYTSTYPDFSRVQVPLVAPRKIPADYVERFTAAFPDYDKMIVAAEASASAHPLTAYYRKYNAALQARMDALATSPKIAAMEEQLAGLKAKLAGIETEKYRAMESDPDYQARKKAFDARNKELQQEIDALRMKNTDYTKARKTVDDTRERMGKAESAIAKKAEETDPEYKKLHDELRTLGVKLKNFKPADAQSKDLNKKMNDLNKVMRATIEKLLSEDPATKDLFFENRKALKSAEVLSRSIEKSGEGMALQQQMQAARAEFKVDGKTLKNLNSPGGLTRDIAQRETMIEKAKVDVAVATNPAEYRAIQRTLYFGKAYERIIKKALLNAVPKPSDDIEQVQMALPFQTGKWHTDADWDGRAPYENVPASIEQPVMQMWLKKMKPWQYSK